MTVLADVVGTGRVTLSVGLGAPAARAALAGKGGTGGTSDETLSFLLAPSSETLRTIVGGCKGSFANMGEALSTASKLEYGACASLTRSE